MSDSLSPIPMNEEYRLEGDMSFEDAWKRVNARLNKALDNERDWGGYLLTFGMVDRDPYKYEKMAKLIVAQVDEQYWSEYTLDNVDLLPTLDRIRSLDVGTVTVAGEEIEITSGTLNVQKQAMDKLTVAITRDFVAGNADEGAISTAAELVRQRIAMEDGVMWPGRDKFEGASDATQERTEDAIEAVGDAAADGTLDAGDFDANAAATGDNLAFDSSGAPAPVLSRQQLDELIAMNPNEALNIALGQAGRFQEQQSYRQQMRDQGVTTEQLNEQVGPLTNASTRVQYTGRREDIGGMGPMDRGYSLNEILAMPTNMTREQIAKITENLEAAGYFEGTGRPGVVGSPSDTNFQQAWRKLVNASVAEGKPMTELLNEQKAAKQEQESILAKVQAALTDPARVRLNADAIARSMIGRKLTPDEQAGLVEYVHNLQRAQAEQEAELENADGDTENVQLDWAARMEEEIRRRNEGEAGAKDIANTYDDFTGILAGPGPGVGRST